MLIFLAPETVEIVRRMMHRTRTDEISINAIGSRWKSWFDALPEPTQEQVAAAREVLNIDEERRLSAVRGAK